MSAFGRAGGGGRRLSRRQSAPLVATISTLSATAHGTLMDLSANGARIRTKPPGVGREVVLIVAGLKVHGTVCWTTGDQCGLVFSEPLTIMEVRHLLHEAAIDGAMKAEVRDARAEWLGGKPR
ncbi:hypothetical protein GCM10022280_26950 [Sphingomonas swuensis]|uniref:PilZ domain-containing protein n=1 Tax=Sphingomonas swuensis TaxID=977800 RepID=A0ABP7TFB7_9SPHN